MEGFRFSVAHDAASFISRVVLANESANDYVVTIAPQTEAMRLDLTQRSLADTVAELELNPPDLRTMQFRWVVGASRRVRFPAKDVFMCDGIPCFVPEEMRPILNGRTLILADGQLRIEPEPPPPARFAGSGR